VKTLPAPPADCSDLRPDQALVTAGSLATDLGLPSLRLFRVGGLPPGATGHALTFVTRRAIPVHRFDDPDARYLVWYGSRTAAGAFLEVFADSDRRFVAPDQQARDCGEVELANDLVLLDLRAPRVLGIVSRPDGLDDGIGTVRTYTLTQAWSRRFFDCKSDLAGFIYRSRLGGELGPNVALFADRTGGALRPLEPGTRVGDVRFAAERETLLRLAGVGWAWWLQT
jgi:RES domain-containing protein